MGQRWDDGMDSYWNIAMTARVRKICYLSVIVLLAMLGLLFLALADPDAMDGGLWILVHSTIFGQTSLVAAWCALGPFSLARRLAISSMWLAAIVVALGLNDSLVGRSDDVDVILTFGAVVLIHWALVATPLWLLATWQGLRFDSEHRHDPVEHLDRQIGIREAMVVTAAVAVVLGAANFRSGGLGEVKMNWEVGRVLGLLTGVSVAVGLPLIVGMLYIRGWLRQVASVLLFVAAVTALELLLLPMAFSGARIDQSTCVFFSFFNLIQSLWIMVAISLLRLGGFSIISKRPGIVASSVGACVGS